MVLPWFLPPFILLLPATGLGAEPVRFRHDVMAVLSKAGCNQGGCHGNQNGKGGFKLSLRGEDPDLDFISLTRGQMGRRIHREQPGRSLVLLKPAGLVPHEGGKRFAVGSLEYQILARWIQGGARPDPAATPRLQRLIVSPSQQVVVEPADRVQVKVIAQFSDGARRDVTRLAVFEPSAPIVDILPNGAVIRKKKSEVTLLVRYLNQHAAVQLAFIPARPDFVWREVPHANYIDRHVLAKLKRLRLLPSELAADSVFLRRVFLDVLGILPTPAETRAFLADARPDKRARLIDRLLKRPEFADHWALKWSDVLRNEEKMLDRKGVQAFHQWIRQRIQDGQPLNEFARDIIAARGSTYRHPPANFYRALRDPQARAESMAQVFLGIRLQCARCHNHPFDRWTQHDYHSLAAFFARIDYKVLANSRLDRLDQHEFAGEQIVFMKREGEVVHPRTGQALPPRFLGDAARPGKDRLAALADWVANPKNPFFARTQANRIWYHLMGHGIVEPNDDFRASNPPLNAPLLDALTKDFAANRFDLRCLVRTILNSRTYQLSAVPNATNRDDQTNYSRALVQPLQAEALLDALSHAMDVPVKFNGYPLGMRAGQLPGVRAYRVRDKPPTAGELFLKAFGKPDRLLTCECERSDATTLNQAFQLLTGRLINEMLQDRNNRIGKLLQSGHSSTEIVEECYLAALCRRPTRAEREAAMKLVAGAKDRRAALEDILWGIVNAKEFLLRR